MREYKFPNAETKICVTIGHPVVKQKSLFMHNAGYESMGINYLYLVRDIAPDRLKAGLESLKDIGVSGISVTMPHKVEVVKYLDVVTDAVSAIGACNTIHVKDGRLVGYNSDWIGAIECLKKKTNLVGTRAVVLGAGGAARAIIYGLLDAGVNKVTVLNRNIVKAEALGKQFNISWGSINDVSQYKEYDVLVNATSVGSKKREDCNCMLCSFLGVGEHDGKQSNVELFLENKIALDVVFQRNTTEFTRAAQARGHNIVYGHEMLVEQGAFQFKLFTGFDAPVDVMYSELKQNLEDW